MNVPCPQFDSRASYSEKVRFLADQVVVFFRAGFTKRVAMDKVFDRYSKNGSLRSLWFEVFFSRQVKSLRREAPSAVRTETKFETKISPAKKEEQLTMF